VYGTRDGGSNFPISRFCDFAILVICNHEITKYPCSSGTEGFGIPCFTRHVPETKPANFLPTLFRINGISNFRRIQKEANSTHGNQTSFHFAKKQFIARQKSTQQRKLAADQFRAQPAQPFSTQFASQHFALAPQFILARTQIEFPPQIQPHRKQERRA
jgi:hypothetical protein